MSETNVKVELQKQWDRAMHIGDVDSAKRLVKVSSLNHFESLRTACEGGHRKLVWWLLQNIPCTTADYNDGLFGACKNGDETLVNWMLHGGARNFSWGLCGACAGGHMRLVDRMIQESGFKLTHLNEALSHSAQGGNFELVKRMHMLGAQIDGSLYHACLGGNPNIVQWFIDKGATTWYLGLCGALKGHHWEIAQDMIRRGALIIKHTFVMYIFGHDVDVLEFMIRTQQYEVFTCDINLNEQVIVSLLNRGISPQVFGVRGHALFNLRRKKQNHVRNILANTLDCDTVGVVIDCITFEEHLIARKCIFE